MRNILVRPKKTKTKVTRKRARLTQYLPPELVNYTKEFTPEQIAGKPNVLFLFCVFRPATGLLLRRTVYNTCFGHLYCRLLGKQIYWPTFVNIKNKHFVKTVDC
jgi:hypothetical protein